MTWIPPRDLLLPLNCVYSFSPRALCRVFFLPSPFSERNCSYPPSPASSDVPAFVVFLVELPTAAFRHLFQFSKIVKKSRRAHSPQSSLLSSSCSELQLPFVAVLRSTRPSPRTSLPTSSWSLRIIFHLEDNCSSSLVGVHPANSFNLLLVSIFVPLISNTKEWSDFRIFFLS